MRQTNYVRLLFSDAESVDSSVNIHHRILNNDANASDPIPGHEPVRVGLSVFRDAGHKQTTRKTELLRERADRHAIERGENEGLMIRTG